MEGLYNDQWELSGLSHDDQPGGPKHVIPIFEDDIVPSLAPDWKPPSFSTEEVQSSQESSSSEEEGIVM